MTNLLNLYRTQVRILWNWRGGWWALTKRIIRLGMAPAAAPAVEETAAEPVAAA